MEFMRGERSVEDEDDLDDDAGETAFEIGEAVERGYADACPSCCSNCKGTNFHNIFPSQSAGNSTLRSASATTATRSGPATASSS